MLLVDASIPPQRMDLECGNWLAEALVRGSSGCGFIDDVACAATRYLQQMTLLAPHRFTRSRRGCQQELGCGGCRVDAASEQHTQSTVSTQQSA